LVEEDRSEEERVKGDCVFVTPDTKVVKSSKLARVLKKKKKKKKKMLREDKDIDSK
jgi:hypothetical protein